MKINTLFSQFRSFTEKTLFVRPYDKRYESDRQMLQRVGRKFAVLFVIILMFDTLLDWFMGLIDLVIQLIQLSWNKAYFWGNLATRTRLEQRFLNIGDDTGWRFRQFLKYTYPLYTERLYLSLWDEVFVNFNDTDWGAKSGFGQNRLFAGVGVFIDPEQHYRFELGYLNQFVSLQSQDDLMNHLISASLFIRY